MKYHSIKLPAVATEDDPLGREPGEALWKERYPIEKLKEIKAAIGSFWFSALYQQNPIPGDGQLFKREYFKYFSVEKDFYILKTKIDTEGNYSKKYISKNDCGIYATADLAVSMKASADFTVVIVAAQTPDNDILILDLYREKIEGAYHLNLLRRVRDKWNPLIIGIESTQYQLSLVQSGLKDGLPVKALKPSKDKRERSLVIISKLEQGMVYFKEDAHWLEDFENELLAFPKGRHDDRVDAFAYLTEIMLPSQGQMPVGTGSGEHTGQRTTDGF